MNKEQELIEYAKQQLKTLQSQITKWQLFLAASNVAVDALPSISNNSSDKQENIKLEKKERKRSSISNGTLKSHIVKFLKENDDLFSGREIFDYVVSVAQYTGNYTSFAGKLSVLVIKKVIAKEVIDDVPNNRKYWYGLTEFWEGGKLKPNYRLKLEKKISG